jgi:hypothetical protein
MNYLLLVAQTEADFDRRSDPAYMRSVGKAWQVYGDALRKAGVFVHGAGLEPPKAAATVRVRDGERHVQDGPYAETKELLASFIIIDVPNIEAALDWAARCPVAAWGAVEVRPIWFAAANEGDS